MTKYDKILNYANMHCDLTIKNDTISDALYQEYDVKRGLRDINGKGVVTGLTRISEIKASREINGNRVSCDGKLWYRNYSINSLMDDYANKRFGYETLAYLLLFGVLPKTDELEEFIHILSMSRDLPTNFTRDVIMKAPTKDIMNSMTKSILTLSSYDRNSHSTELSNVIRQCLLLISVFPMLAVYGYHAYNHYENMKSMYIHRPKNGLSTSENILRLLRADMNYTITEVNALDAALMLHMEHGGGNNSTFTTRVVTSAGSDTYATIAAAMSSLKGPKHGGANIKVMEMMKDIKKHINTKSDESLRDYLSKMLDGNAFDGKGLIYGMGHAIYSVSDPRERILKEFVKKLAKEKGMMHDFALYEKVEKIAPEVIAEKRRIYKGVCANVDFYSGFVYKMLGIPEELYTPIFAIARIVGWSAHRMEEIIGAGKIIRPAYTAVGFKEMI